MKQGVLSRFTSERSARWPDARAWKVGDTGWNFFFTRSQQCAHTTISGHLANEPAASESSSPFVGRSPSRHSMHSMRRRRNSSSHSLRGERKIERFFEPERPTMVIYATERNHDVSLPPWSAICFPPSFSRLLLLDWDRELNFRFDQQFRFFDVDTFYLFVYFFSA